MALGLILIVFMLGVGVFAWQRKARITVYLQQVRIAAATHKTVAGLLFLYSVLCGVLLVVGFDSAVALVLLGLPIIAGGVVGWWVTPRPPAGGHAELPIIQGALAGGSALLLPALILLVGQVVLTWRTSPSSGRLSGIGELLAELIGWLALLGGAGMLLGVVGALGGAGLVRMGGRLQGGGPTTR